VRRWSRLLLIPVAGYVCASLMVGVLQRKLIYFPPKISAAELAPMAAQNRLLPWTNAVGIRIGWFRPAPRPPAEATTFIMHGNAGSAVGREYIFDPIQKGINAEIFVLEYPGYADRLGKPSQAAFVAAASEGLSLITNRAPVVLVGESLGTGVACQLAGSRPSAIRGVILLVPFDSLVNTARHHYPWLPVGLLLIDRFHSDEALPAFGGPVVFALAGNDELIPIERGKRLHDLYPGPKRLIIEPDANHWMGSQTSPAFYENAWKFIEQNRKP
jgi:pimeloyl-ACP methyl ester carboxylesterase